VSADERLLRPLLGRRVVAQEIADEAADPRSMAIEDQAKRLGVAGPGAREEPFVPFGAPAVHGAPIACRAGIGFAP